MDLRSQRSDTVRVLGTMAMVAGLVVSLLTLWGDAGPVALHLFAGILVLAGVGLRIEAAITAARK